MKAISGIVGLVLILAAVVIVVLSTSKETYAEKQAAIVQKYVDLANEALMNDNYKGALKFAKMAIEADPTNNNGFKIYESVMNLKYQSAAPAEPAATQQSAPAAAQADEEDLGC